MKIFNTENFLEHKTTMRVVKNFKENKEIPESIKVTESLEKLGFRFPEVVMAQAIHETAHFTSNIYIYCNNLFGMKFNERGYAIGVCREHAEYANKRDSIKDYLAYQKKYLTYYEKNVIRRTCLTNEDYHKFLLWIGYAEDDDYISKIKVYEEAIKEESTL